MAEDSKHAKESDARRMLREIRASAPRETERARELLFRAVGTGRSQPGLPAALTPIVQAINFVGKVSRDRELVNELAYELLRALANAQVAANFALRDRRRERLVRDEVWTRKRLERFRRFQRELRAASPKRRISGRMRFFGDRKLVEEFGRSFVVPGTFSVKSVRLAPSGSGRRAEIREELEVLMSYLVGTLGLPVAAAARAAAELCRLFLGRREDPESIRRWYFRQAAHR